MIFLFVFYKQNFFSCFIHKCNQNDPKNQVVVAASKKTILRSDDADSTTARLHEGGIEVSHGDTTHLAELLTHTHIHTAPPPRPPSSQLTNVFSMHEEVDTHMDKGHGGDQRRQWTVINTI